MNILIINYEYPPLGAGAGKQSQLLAEELSKKHKVFVLTSYLKGLKKKETINNNLEISRVDVGRKFYHKASALELFLFLVLGFFFTLKLSKKEKTDISIAFFTVPSGLISYMIKRLFNIPYIVSLRGFDVPGFSVGEFGLLQKLNGIFIKTVLKNADAVVSNGTYLKQLIQKYMGNIDVKVIPNAVIDIPKIKKKQLKKEKPDQVKILTVCRLTSQKRVGYLISIMDKMITKISFRLDIIGDGPLKDSLIMEAKKTKASKDIFFHGWQDREKVDKFYNNSDIFVLFSVEEGMSNVLLEAVSRGLPILAMDIESNRNIVKDGINGFLVPPNDPALAVYKLSLLMEDSSLRERFSKKSLEISKKYSPAKMAESFESLIKRIKNEY